MEKIKSKSYALYSESGSWLGQIVLTSDGMSASVTDYGNLSYAWRSFGKDFRDFLLNINADYFGTKMYGGLAYIAYGSKFEKSCKRFAEMLLPALQKALKDEIQRGETFLWVSHKVKKI